MGVGGGVQRIEVTERDTSVFNGAELGAVGIYEQLPDSVPLAPLLASGSDLKGSATTRTLMTAAVLAPTPMAPKGTKSITY
jgi:hypothetical protein